MNIKIFTFFYSNNYGALIQALSLKEFLSNNSNAEVKFANYQPKNLLYREIYRPIIKKNLLDSIKNLIKSYRIRNWKKSKKLPKPTQNKEIQNTSLSVYGSDAIWMIFSYLGFQPYYFGDKNDGYKISYAASIGPTIYQESQGEIKEKIKLLLNRFDHISVRDTNTAELVKQVTGRQPQIVVDPIFLTDLNFLDFKKKKENFILVYGVVFSKEEKLKIIKFSKSKNLKIISIGYYNNWVDKNYIYANPEEFLSYISQANYVFTSMFHGIMFSVKFKKNFWYSQDRIRTNKIGYFIDNLDLSNRLIEKSENFSEEIDYIEVDKKLQPWIKSSKDYLTMCIREKGLL